MHGTNCTCCSGVPFGVKKFEKYCCVSGSVIAAWEPDLDRPTGNASPAKLEREATSGGAVVSELDAGAFGVVVGAGVVEVEVVELANEEDDEVALTDDGVVDC